MSSLLGHDFDRFAYVPKSDSSREDQWKSNGLLNAYTGHEVQAARKCTASLVGEAKRSFASVWKGVCEEGSPRGQRFAYLVEEAVRVATSAAVEAEAFASFVSTYWGLKNRAIALKAQAEILYEHSIGVEAYKVRSAAESALVELYGKFDLLLKHAETAYRSVSEALFCGMISVMKCLGSWIRTGRILLVVLVRRWKRHKLYGRKLWSRCIC